MVTLAGHSAAHAQQAPAWQPTARLQADLQYDDNPFLLTVTQKPKLQTVSAVDGG